MELTDRPARNADVSARSIEELFFLLHPDTSELHQVNDVGRRIWELADGQRSVGDISDAVAAEYDVEPGVAQADVLEFLEELRTKDLIRV